MGGWKGLLPASFTIGRMPPRTRDRRPSSNLPSPRSAPRRKRNPTGKGVTDPPLGLGQALSAWPARWPVLLIWSVLGGALGLAFSALRPAVYEAEAVLAVSIDYGRTAPLELIVEDRLLDRVWAYLTSDMVLTDTLERMRDGEGSDLPWGTPAELRKNARLEARLSRWTFIGSHSDPNVAATIANAWAESAQEALSEALDHAWRAVELQEGVFFPNCLQILHGPTKEELWECFSRGARVGPQQVAALREEINAAHGVSPMVSYSFVDRAFPPASPVIRDRGWLVLSGTFAGLLIAAGHVMFPPETWSRSGQGNTKQTPGALGR